MKIKHGVSLVCRKPLYRFPLDRIRARRANSSAIDNVYGETVDRDGLTDEVARDPRVGPGDHAFALGERIEERRFAAVGASGDQDPKGFGKPPGGRGRPQELAELVEHGRAPRLARIQRVDQRLDIP